MRRSRAALAPIFAVVALAASCGDGPTTAIARVPASLAILSGDGQSGVAGTALPQPVTVVVRDASAQPVPNVVLAFAEQGADSAFVEVGQATTNGDGVAAYRWTPRLPTGDKVLRIRLASDTLPLEARARALATVSDLVGISPAFCCNVGDPVFAGTTVTRQFRVSGPAGGVAGTRVHLALTGPAGGSVTPSEALAGADGIVSVQWTIGPDTGTYRLSAWLDAADPIGTRTAYDAFVQSGVPTQLRIVSGAGQRVFPSQSMSPVVARLTDAAGRPVPGIGGQWLDGSGSSPCNALTNAAGETAGPCSFATGATPGSYTVAVTMAGLRAEAAVTMLAPPASVRMLSPAPGATVAAGATTDSLRARVLLADGSPAVAYPVTFGLPATGFSTDLPVFTSGTTISVLTNDLGIAAAPWVAPGEPGIYPVGASSGYGYRQVVSDTVQVRASGTLHVRTLSAGGAHTCAVARHPLWTSVFNWSFGLSEVFCWGRNTSGQLANGSFASAGSPAIVPALIKSAYLQAVSAGATHTCIVDGTTSVDHSGGTTLIPKTLCAGANTFGQLGVAGGDQASPVTVPGVLGAFGGGVSAGTRHTCALAGGQVRCWGDNARGALGDGTTTNNLMTTALLPAGVTAASVSAGDGFTCALSTAGAAYCWGANDTGQLGDGGTSDRSQPVAVAGGIVFDPTVPITTGGAHACAVRAGGAAYCWGRNDAGQLGDGTITTRTQPVAVAGGLVLASVSAGGAHTCGLTGAGTAWCWGANSSGQLGIGVASAPAHTPQPVAGGISFAMLSAGQAHTCGASRAASNFGTAYCWGLNADGQLGDGTTTDRAAPVAVAPFQ